MSAPLKKKRRPNKQRTSRGSTLTRMARELKLRIQAFKRSGIPLTPEALGKQWIATLEGEAKTLRAMR